MNVESLTQHAEEKLALVKASVMSDSFIIQLTTIAVIYCIAFLLARQVKKPFKFTREKPEQGAHTMHGFLYNLGEALFPLITISMLKLTTVLGAQFQFDAWLLEIAVVVALMLFVNSLITGFVENKTIAGLMRWVGLPILFLHLVGVLPLVTTALASIAISVGNVEVSAYGVTRVVLFGGLLWAMFRFRTLFASDGPVICRLFDWVAARMRANGPGLRTAICDGVVWPRDATRRAAVFLGAIAAKLIAATHFVWAGLAVGVVLAPWDYIFLMVFSGFIMVLGRFVRIPGSFIFGAGFALQMLGVPPETALFTPLASLIANPRIQKHQQNVRDQHADHSQ